MMILLYRTLMERREFDFVSHDEFCSGRCISKNNRLVSASYSDGGTPGATASVAGDFSEYLYPLTLPSNPYTQFLQGYHHDLQAGKYNFVPITSFP